MTSTGIAAIAAAAAFMIYAFWVLGKPSISPLVDEETAGLLRGGLPEGSLGGNKIETFPGFDPMVESMITDIAGARHHVHILFFKFEDDPVGRRFVELLSQKVKEGVEIRLMYDDGANLKRRKFFRQMQDAGIETLGFNLLHLPFPSKYNNYRNHRKIVVVDGRVAYIGGMNIAERYGKGLFWGCWRDTQIRIEGPAAAQSQLAFAMDWAHEGGKLLTGPEYYPLLPEAGNSAVETLCAGPIGDGPVIMERICSLIDSCSKRVWIESPYLIPTKEIKRSLFAAARRGVDVRIILPPRGDRGVFTPLATKSYVAEFLAAGVKIAEYQDGYMHSKMHIFDDRLVSQGSTNIDVRSYIIDEEINVFIDDHDYNRQMQELFLTDESRSVYIKPAEWARRPVLQRIGEAISRIPSFQL
ncbi:MAG: cardiolipin synthase [Bacteroidales bacterium]|nr:cardiolipin synthase [Bacteroidales bacterium]